MKSKRAKRGSKSRGKSQQRESGGSPRPPSHAPLAPNSVVAAKRAQSQREKELRKHLDERLRALYQRVMLIEHELRELDQRFYRVCIFGSARMKPETESYQQVFTLARYMAWEGIDVLTGGGPGLMEAANRGAKLGQQEKQTKSLSFGLSIELDFEPAPNLHLDVKRHHHKFSSRLDDFMRLSHSIVVTPGGIGTLLELYFSWQLLQVRHLDERPIVLLDRKFWNGLLDWMRAQPLARGLMGGADFRFLSIVDTPEEAFEILSKHHKEFLKSRKTEPALSRGE